MRVAVTLGDVSRDNKAELTKKQDSTKFSVNMNEWMISYIIKLNFLFKLFNIVIYK